jgi:hypothetical protein
MWGAGHDRCRLTRFRDLRLPYPNHSYHSTLARVAGACAVFFAHLFIAHDGNTGAKALRRGEGHQSSASSLDGVL